MSDASYNNWLFRLHNKVNHSYTVFLETQKRSGVILINTPVNYKKSDNESGDFTGRQKIYIPNTKVAKKIRNWKKKGIMYDEIYTLRSDNCKPKEECEDFEWWFDRKKIAFGRYVFDKYGKLTIQEVRGFLIREKRQDVTNMDIIRKNINKYIKAKAKEEPYIFFQKV